MSLLRISADGVSTEMNRQDLGKRVYALVGQVPVGLLAHSTLICSTRICFVFKSKLKINFIHM